MTILELHTLSPPPPQKHHHFRCEFYPTAHVSLPSCRVVLHCRHPMGQLGETKLPSAKFLWKQACPVTIVGPDIDISAGAAAAASAWLSPVRGWPWRKGEPRPTDRPRDRLLSIDHALPLWREGGMDVDSVGSREAREGCAMDGSMPAAATAYSAAPPLLHMLMLIRPRTTDVDLEPPLTHSPKDRLRRPSSVRPSSAKAGPVSPSRRTRSIIEQQGRRFL